MPKVIREIEPSVDEIQSVINAWRNLRDLKSRKEAVQRLHSLLESHELEIEHNDAYIELEAEMDRQPGSSASETHHHIVCGDILQEKTLDFIPEVDLVFTSPPYNADIEYDVYHDKRPIDEYLCFLTGFIHSCNKRLRPGGRFIINIRDISCGSGERLPIIVPLYTLFKQIGYFYRGVHIWYKGREESSFAWGSYCSSMNPAIIDLFEYVFVFQKPGERVRKRDDIDKSDFIESVIGVWKIRPVKKIVGKNKNNTCGHPCPFPPELVRRAVKLYSQVGDTVLDPFGGVMNTAIGAYRAGRNSVCVDISPTYCETGYQRLRGIMGDSVKFERA